VNTSFGIQRGEELQYSKRDICGFTLNGKKVLIRGAGWTDDIFLSDNSGTATTNRYSW
jgi:exo-1,4-beta-D-glucosaminidase